MPVLRKAEEEKLYLPSTEHEANEADKGYVVIRKKLIASDIATISEENISAFDRAVNTMAELITDWNYFEEDGTTKLPVTVENIRRLDIDDFTFLSIEIGKIAEGVKHQESLPPEEKKTLSSTSTPQIPGVSQT